MIRKIVAIIFMVLGVLGFYLVCMQLVHGQSAITLSSDHITYVTGEYQIVSATPRSQFNLSLGHVIGTQFFSVAIYKNGLRLTPDVNYGRSAFTINLTTPANPGDILLFDYAFQ